MVAKQEQSSSWIRANPKKVLALLLMLVFLGFVLLAEWLLSLRGHGGRQSHIGIQRAIVLREHQPGWQGMVDAVLEGTDSLENKQFRLRIDKDGFIEPSRIYPNPEITIAFQGGSTTECIFVDEEFRFPYLAGRELEKLTGKRVNSFNAAASGNTSMHTISILLTKVLPLHPDIVVAMENWNDLIILLLAGSYWNDHPTRSLFINDMTKAGAEFGMRRFLDNYVPHLYVASKSLFQPLYSLIRFGGSDEWAGVRGKKVEVDEAALANEFRMNLTSYAAIANAHHVKSVFMTMASRISTEPDAFTLAQTKTLEDSYGISYAEFKKLLDSFNDVVREVASQNNAGLIDLERYVPKENTFIYDQVHYNTKGSRFVSSYIAERLKEIISKSNTSKEK